MSGMELDFNGFVLHIKHTGGKGTKKVFPAGVYFQSVNSWKHSDLDGAKDVLAEFLEAKSATATYNDMCAAIKATRMKGASNALLAVATLGIKGHGHPEKKVKEIAEEYKPKFAALGITIGVCQVTVNLGSRTPCRFLWVEFVDDAVVEDGYLPDFGGALLE